MNDYTHKKYLVRNKYTGETKTVIQKVVEMIDTVLSNPEDEKIIASVREKVNKTMEDYPMFAY